MPSSPVLILRCVCHYTTTQPGGINRLTSRGLGAEKANGKANQVFASALLVDHVPSSLLRHRSIAGQRPSTNFIWRHIRDNCSLYLTLSIAMRAATDHDRSCAGIQSIRTSQALHGIPARPYHAIDSDWWFRQMFYGNRSTTEDFEILSSVHRTGC